ncbi:peptidoglycan-binding protein [Sphaerospermopsis aphanizomenoides BCCUSP55]|uniref:peptidoglycan-binding domain-containing protein n=1 Tax=Sphaerospermopsis aphanizomenoides TaxID=459663 RepID=UPI000A8F6634|nr:peptidoglycan-binding protein [Sphaerospermopsis aphanizomenoides]MBK1988557.1 peptidoglycan-binding protein [Sphaerospermopsis aphanizomenoides BCCUSP55]
MTELGLLMTGVLSTTQPTLPHLPEHRPFPRENGVQKSTNSQLSQLNFTSQITPPEFIKTDGREQPNMSALTIKREKILAQVKQKYLSQASSKLADAQNIPPKQRVLARYPASSQQSMPTLRFGSAGISVRIMQKLLVSKGYGVRVDGIFGPLTEAAIKAFQNQRNLFVDGVVGQRTWWELSI